MKECFTCKQTLDSNFFHKDSRAVSGLSSNCKNCHNNKYKKSVIPKSAAKYAATIKGRAKRLIGSAKRRYYGCDLEITEDWVIKKLKKGVCEFTGLPFDFNPTKEFSKNPYSPSLDRIDSKNKSYTPENTRVVLSLVNLALNEFGEEVAAPILKAMVAAIESKHG
jgi:hypothetical protein